MYRLDSEVALSRMNTMLVVNCNHFWTIVLLLITVVLLSNRFVYTVSQPSTSLYPSVPVLFNMVSQSGTRESLQGRESPRARDSPRADGSPRTPNFENRNANLTGAAEMATSQELQRLLETAWGSARRMRTALQPAGIAAAIVENPNNRVETVNEQQEERIETNEQQRYAGNMHTQKEMKRAFELLEQEKARERALEESAAREAAQMESDLERERLRNERHQFELDKQEFARLKDAQGERRQATSQYENYIEDAGHDAVPHCGDPGPGRRYGDLNRGTGYRETYRNRYEQATGVISGPQLQTSTAGFGLNATLGNIKFTVPMPEKFDPKVMSWLLWKPRIMDYFTTIQMEGVLDPNLVEVFTRQEHKYVIAALQSVSPDEAAAWMSTLRCEYAHEAFAQLERKYGSRSDLDMQRKLHEFGSATQADGETVRDWVIRLERQVTELNLMSREAGKMNVAGYNESHDIAVTDATHKFRLLNVRSDNQAHEAFMATLRINLQNMTVQQVEEQLISHEQGRDIQRQLTSAGASSSQALWQTNTEQPVCTTKCNACGNYGHTWAACRVAGTPEGRARISSMGYRVPDNFVPRKLLPGESYHGRAPNAGRGYGRGRGRAFGRGAGRFGRGYNPGRYEQQGKNLQ